MHEKPSFKESISNRCIIIATGYFEWEWLDPKGKQKQKYEIHPKNEQIFAFAGQYCVWTDRSTDEMMNNYSMIKTDANELMAKIHNKLRIPVVLKLEDDLKWLDHSPIMGFAFPNYEIDLIGTEIESPP